MGAAVRAAHPDDVAVATARRSAQNLFAVELTAGPPHHERRREVLKRLVDVVSSTNKSKSCSRSLGSNGCLQSVL
jgi:hypothetical protein